MSRPVRIIVVAYHASTRLEQCLAGLGVGVTVVDNSSSAEVEAVSARHGAEYLNPGLNLGFSAGVNVALRHFAAREPADVLLLNPDAVIGGQEIDELSEFLHAHDQAAVGAVAPRLAGEDGREQRVLWPFPSPARAWVEAVGFGRRRARQTFAVGAVLLLRAEALDEVGLLDERFFLYAEETDWQRRALELGWSSVVCESVCALHVTAGSSPNAAIRESQFHAAQEIYIRKWFGLSGWVSYRAAVILGSVARALALRDERRAIAARRALLYARGPRRVASLTRR